MLLVTSLSEVVYLEATCGHEFMALPQDAAAETKCPVHGLVGLWAQRLEASTPDPLPLPPPLPRRNV